MMDEKWKLIKELSELYIWCPVCGEVDISEDEAALDAGMCFECESELMHEVLGKTKDG